jgi:hypothetical protein
MLMSLLIPLVGKRLGLVFARVLPYFLVIVGILLAGWWIDGNGYDRGVRVTDAKYHAAIIKERHRQIEANAAALEEARVRQVKLRELLDARETLIEELTTKATEDPDANRRAISSDSVRRINRVH